MTDNRRFIDFVVEGIIFVLAVSSIAQSIISSLYLPISYGQVLVLSLFFYILLSIYMYNKLTILIGIPFTIYFFILYARKNLPMDWCHRGVEYIYWLVDHALGNNPPMDPIYIDWSVWSITGVTSLIFFLLIIKLNLPILSVGFAGAVIGIEWYLGHDHITPYIWIYALASICLISAGHRKSLSRKYKMPGPGLWQLAILPLALIIVLGSVVTVPPDTNHLKWEYLGEQFEHLENKWTSSSKSKDPRTSFRLTQTGFQTSSDKLGGPVELKDGLLLKVKSPQPVYLRGTILNEYTGTGWTDSISAMKYKLSDPLNNKNRDKALDFDEDFWKDPHSLEVQGLISRFTIDVEPVGIETSAIFAPLRTISVKPHARREFSPYINDKGELFTANNVVDIKGYTLDIVYINSRHRDVLAMLNSYIPQINFREYIPSDYREYQKILDIQKSYSTIGDSVPKRILELAEDITKHASTPMEKALAIEEYLMQNYEYTLTPPHTPEGRDFVDYFLFDLWGGYCTYFASAMAVMGRAVGLPTRYVEGFSMPPTPKHDMIYEVQKSNSHAWVEVYFPDVGWLTFDPTPATHWDRIAIEQNQVPPEDYSNLDEYLDDHIEMPEDIDPVDREIIYEDVSRDRTYIKIKPVLLLVYVVVALVALLVVSILIFSWMYRRRISKLPYSRQIDVYYTKIIDLLKLYSFPIDSGETPYSYANRVDTWLINEAGSMMDIATLIVKSNFSDYSPNMQDIHMVKKFYDNLKADTKKIIGRTRYIISTLNNIPKYFRVWYK